VCSYCFRFIGSVEFQIGHRLYLQNAGSSIGCHSERHCRGSESGSSTGSPGVTKGNGEDLPLEVIESLITGETSLPFSDHFALPEVVSCHGCEEERYCRFEFICNFTFSLTSYSEIFGMFIEA
jgi:hypothetical protein